MAELLHSIFLPFQGRIKVYDTPDGSDVPWSQPRRIHLHETTPSGATLCCASVTVGGVVEDPNKKLLWITSDRLVPRPERQLRRHADTSDESCVCIGCVQHTSRKLNYTLINIHVDTSQKGPIRYGTHCISGQLSYKATLHPVLAKYLHRQSDLVVMTRSRNEEVMTGHITVLPTKVVRPAYLATGELMVAQFDPSCGRVPGKIDAGTWVYVRKPVGGDSNPIIEEERAFPRLNDRGRYAGIFNRNEDDGILRQDNVPVVLLGHIVEVRDRGGDENAKVEVTIQSSYEVLTEIFVQRGKLNHLSGVERISMGTY
ncbi:hypothetical protein F4781DRAFT_150609 [Annulohypoxylon bovei var. microspora]|nr:hypothetical protein F4781DRAFT_150609 [Annulohypoxylon bovei var. microspora]